MYKGKKRGVCQTDLRSIHEKPNLEYVTSMDTVFAGNVLKSRVITEPLLYSLAYMDSRSYWLEKRRNVDQPDALSADFF